MALREDSSRPSQLVAWLVSKAVEGLPNVNLSGAQELAQSHRAGNPTLEVSRIHLKLLQLSHFMPVL